MARPSPETVQLKIEQEQGIALTNLRNAQAGFYKSLPGW